MTLADKVTSIRLVLAPIFFVIYLLPRFFPAVFGMIPPADANSHFFGAAWTVPILWVLYVGSEITDMLDGMIARKQGLSSDFGKLFDPFADTLTQITYFFCFVIDDILPPFLFLAVLYREFSILFVRNLMLRKGVALGARLGGKIKTVTYILAGGLALLATSILRLGISGQIYSGLIMAAEAVFVVSVIIAVVSFFDYVSMYLKIGANTEKK